MTASSEKKLRKEICEVGQRMADRGLVMAMDGNISVRLDDDRFLFTPTGCNLGAMSPEDLVVTDEDGTSLGEGDVTSEYRLHLVCYRSRPDVEAVIHAHPPHSVAATVAGVRLDKPVLPEVVFTLGSIPTLPYATPASVESSEAIKGYVETYDAMLLDRHGPVTLGRGLQEAYMKLEKVEHAAQVQCTAKDLGTVKVLPRKEVQKLKELGKKYGLNPRAVPEDEAWVAMDEK